MHTLMPARPFAFCNLAASTRFAMVPSVVEGGLLMAYIPRVFYENGDTRFTRTA